MLDWQVNRINSELRHYDRTLFCHRTARGAILVLRKADRLDASDYNQTLPDLVSLNPQFIFALTDDWTANGHPVERGIEPLMERLRAMDLWNKTDVLDSLKKNRETEEARSRQSFRNDIGAKAADLRRDFAKATNDFNTSTI